MTNAIPDSSVEASSENDAASDGTGTSTDEPDAAGDLRPLFLGVVAGALAWVAGYAVTYGLARESIRADLRTDVLESAAGETLTAELVAWTYLNAHGVATEVPRRGLFRLLPPEQNVVLDGSGAEWLLLLIPPLVIALAGAYCAYDQLERLESITEAAIDGAMVAIGYLAVTIVAVLLSTVAIEGAVIRPSPLESILVAGIGYPIVFGALGAVALVRLRASGGVRAS
ncbi:hypothetical protein [Natronosalvus rutilus]|uniref:DUF7978 domain-containing protein n=1 Tax=Natronosalvus rutilus TaxID=2953753 RepID=A0A9E7SVK7_9EURY|nr:hypothetical protein [Natronosalvus rutilus]UTF52378.1 hypothetical protein NGM29_11310 [Natronosalvus rutilus]